MRTNLTILLLFITSLVFAQRPDMGSFGGKNAALHNGQISGKLVDAKSGDELLGDADLLVPVPLHRWRLLRRRFNQAAILAQQAADDALAAFPNGEAVLAALCRLQTSLLTLEKAVAPRHVHRIHLKMRQAGMAACEAAAMQFRFEVNPAVPVVGQQAEARLSWHVADCRC